MASGTPQKVAQKMGILTIYSYVHEGMTHKLMNEILKIGILDECVQTTTKLKNHGKITQRKVLTLEVLQQYASV